MRFSQCESGGIGTTNAHINWGEKAVFPRLDSSYFFVFDEESLILTVKKIFQNF